jgi:pilus assembly protein CpaE
MLNAILISESMVSADVMRALCEETGILHLLEWFPRYPGLHELIRFLNSRDIEVLLIDVSDIELALPLMAAVREAAPGLSIVAFGPGCEGEARDDVAAIADEMLTSPVTAEVLSRSTETALHRRAKDVTNLYAFLPSKAGSGCTTVVLNIAGILAKRLEQTALVLECDLHSGILSILLNVEPKQFVQDVFGGATRLDSFVWQRLVTERFGADWLTADRQRKRPLAEWYDYFKLLQFAHQQYNWILADLPEVVNDGTAEIVRTAKDVFVVCTPEILSLRLAARRCSELKDRGVAEEKVKIVVNRWREEEVKTEDVEEFLQHPVAAVVPSDYMAVRQSIIDSSLVDPTSTLGEMLEDLACQIAGLPAPQRAEKSSTFSRMKKLWS